MKKLEYIKKLKGDASFRKFFRKKNKEKSSIIVYAKKEKRKNLLIYDSINRVLNKNNILAPKLYEENYKKDYIVIQDFGNETIYKILNKNNNKLQYFKKIIKLLIKIQSIKDKKIKNFKKKQWPPMRCGPRWNSSSRGSPSRCPSKWSSTGSRAT